MCSVALHCTVHNLCWTNVYGQHYFLILNMLSDNLVILVSMGTPVVRKSWEDGLWGVGKSRQSSVTSTPFSQAFVSERTNAFPFNLYCFLNKYKKFSFLSGGIAILF